ncbi:MAG TPA: DMT family transporter [Bradyrhizobium sp.]|jgi:drug/metabolite transporter (DMT)-like permease|nr:DMT family transporter [Bradyrhizobium sp.]
MSLFAKISTAADARSARLAGIGLMLAGVGFFSLGDVIGKYMVATYSVGQLLLLRAVAALILMAPMIWRSRAAFAGVQRPALQVLRVILSITEIAAFFAAAVYLPLADIITFYLAAPIFVTALSAVLLGEHVDIRRWAAIGVGFCGVLIALRPSGGVFGWSAAIALGGSVAFAFLMVVTRSLRGTPDIVLASMQFFGSLVFGLVAAPVGWLTPSPRDFGFFMLAGGLAVLASLSVNRSLKLAAASVVVPYQYSMIVWAAIFGYLVFGDVPSMATIFGAAIIIGAGFYIFLRERELGPGETVVSPPVP